MSKKDLEARVKSHAYDPYELLQCSRWFYSEFNDAARAKEVLHLALDAASADYSVAGVYFDAAEIATDLMGDAEFAAAIRSKLCAQEMNCIDYADAYRQFEMIQDMDNARAMMVKAAQKFDDSIDLEQACFYARECAESLNDKALGLKFTNHCISLNPTQSYELQGLIEALAVCADFKSAEEWLSKYKSVASADEVKEMTNRINEIKAGN